MPNGMVVSSPIMIDGLPFTGSVAYKTNWPNNIFITNTWSRNIFVSEVTTNSAAAVAGRVGTELWVGYTTNSITVLTVDTPSLTTVLAGVATVQQFKTSGVVPPGGYFCFTNLSSGLNNLSSVRLDSGQLIILP